jgi:hypothetical protein
MWRSSRPRRLSGGASVESIVALPTVGTSLLFLTLLL